MAEETILTGDDLMTGLPSPVVPPELAHEVLEGVETCAEHLRSLFQCLHHNDIEPFCQDEIIRFRKCSQLRDQTLRSKIMEAEAAWDAKLSEEEARDRREKLEAATALLERRMILANAVEGRTGFQQRWRLHGEFQDTRARVALVDKRLEDLQRVQENARKRSWWHLAWS